MGCSVRLGVLSMRLLAVALVAFFVSPAADSGARQPVSFGGIGANAVSASWAIGAEAALPANAAATDQKVAIDSVSCASGGNCGAVGTYLDSSGNTQGLLLTETAGTWGAGVEARLPANAASTHQFVRLNSVSCASAGNCTAVGGYADSSGNSEGLIITQTAATWAVGQEVTAPANAATNPGVGLASISCPTAGNCGAVGSYTANSGNNTEALLLTETAGSWSAGIEAVLPADAATFNQNANLGSISCPSAGNCGAVGGHLFMSGPDSWASQGLMVSETGGTWATGVEPSLPADASTPNPGVGLSSISCASAGNCTTVGGYSDNTPTSEGLLLTQTAGAWATGLKAKLPANAATAAPGPLTNLNSVSCASAGNCAAVGTYYDDSANRIREGVMLTQTAGNWATGVEAALPADADSSVFQVVSLTSVSCPSAGNCSAVGGYNISSGVGADLLLTQTGGSWASGLEASLPSNASSALGIDSISCPTAADCSAVGSYELNFLHGGTQGLLLGTTATTQQATLSISRSGAGSGTITSSPAGIDCGTSCSTQFDLGSEVTLTATPNPNSYLIGWDAAGCDNTGPCQVAINGDTTVTANFGLKSYLLTVQKAGNGSGSVSSSPSGIDCGTTCTSSFNDGTPVTLTATPQAGSTFTGWSGGGCSGTGTCKLTVTADTTVTPTFAAASSYALTVSKSGNGSGSVASSPSGINCGPACSHHYPGGTSVTLTAFAASGSNFAGWSGACTGTAACTVTMSVAHSVVASFLRDCVVPALKGKTLKAAKQTLTAHSCSLGQVKHKYSMNVKKGHVIAQKPRPYEQLRPGGEINLTISKGRP